MEPTLREERAMERFEEALERELKTYGGQIPFLCNDCGEFDTPSELVICCACGSENINMDLSRMEFAELIGMLDPQPEKDDNPVEDEEFGWRVRRALRSHNA